MGNSTSPQRDACLIKKLLRKTQETGGWLCSLTAGFYDPCLYEWSLGLSSPRIRAVTLVLPNLITASKPLFSATALERDVASVRYLRTVEGTSQKAKKPGRTYILRLTHVSECKQRRGLGTIRPNHGRSTSISIQPGYHMWNHQSEITSQVPISTVIHSRKVKKPRKRARYHPSCNAAASTASRGSSPPQFSSPG